MRFLNVFLIFFASVLLSYSCIAQQKVNASDFGLKADGLFDNSMSLEKFLQYCVDNDKVGYIPRRDKPYVLNKPIFINITSGKTLRLKSNGAVLHFKPVDLDYNPSRLLLKLSPRFKEVCMISLGVRTGKSTFKDAYGSDANNSVFIDGLTIKGNKDASSSNQIIFSAIDVSTDRVNLSNVKVSSFHGYGIRSYGAKNAIYSSITIDDVGGRSKELDSYGDGLYFAGLKKDATIKINRSNISGAVINQIRSRSGITFEFSEDPYQADIENTVIDNFAKSIHFEDHSKAMINITSCRLTKFNYAIAMVANKDAVCNVINSEINCTGTDGFEKGDGGPTINTDNGGVFKFYNSKISLNGRSRAYLTSVGVKLFFKCTIMAHNKNPYFADGNILFDKCRFVDFGGQNFSFFSYGKTISTVEIKDATFVRGGQVHAKGARVNLINSGKKSPNIIASTFHDK